MSLETDPPLRLAQPENAPLSWGAVLAGAVAGTATSVVLTLLAAGFGYTLASGAIATRGSLAGFTPLAGAGAVAVQAVSAGLAGYLAGRLRPDWSDAHTDEAHFRDTAHGLLAWAVMTVAGVILAVAALGPYADALAGGAAAASTPVDARRAAEIAAQSSFFMAVGLLVSGFTATVAGRIGGLRNDEMRVRLRP